MKSKIEFEVIRRDLASLGYQVHENFLCWWVTLYMAGDRWLVRIELGFKVLDGAI